MAEKVKIRVHPSGIAADMLTVADAMRQVLDFIELLEAAGGEVDSDAEKVVWRLNYATTNSPFEVCAEATSIDPTISVAMTARRTKAAVKGALSDMLSGKSPPPWFNDRAHATSERIFKRNLNGVGRTDIDYGDQIEPTIVVHTSAKQASLAIEQYRLDMQKQEIDLTRSEFGSVEGEIISTSRFHNDPSVIIKHRLSNDRITCVIPTKYAEAIGPNHSWTEVWSGKRILVTGELHYQKDGSIKKVDAISLTAIPETDVKLSALRDRDLTGSLSTSDFLGKVWGE